MYYVIQRYYNDGKVSADIITEYTGKIGECIVYDTYDEYVDEFEQYSQALKFAKISKGA